MLIGLVSAGLLEFLTRVKPPEEAWGVPREEPEAGREILCVVVAKVGAWDEEEDPEVAGSFEDLSDLG